MADLVERFEDPGLVRVRNADAGIGHATDQSRRRAAAVQLRGQAPAHASAPRRELDGIGDEVGQHLSIYRVADADVRRRRLRI